MKQINIYEESGRCLLCADAPCSKVCKNGNPARAVRAIRFGNEKLAGQWISQCTDEELETAEKACIHYDRPIRIRDDPILCENTEPKLSSIQPNFIEEGRLAAELLEQMMSGGKISSGKRLSKVGIRAIVHRESTVAQSESGKLVQKVLAYIGREATRGIGVEEVARRFKVSRSLLELRFRELQNESVYEAMLRIRLEEVKRLLRQTNDPISEITSACGWENPIPPKALFKRRFGISMREYRAQNSLR